MRMMFVTGRLLVSLLVVLLLNSCASLARFQQLMDSYIGQPIASVQEAFGYNFIERQLDDERKTYTWLWSRQGVTPGYRTPTTIYSTGLARPNRRDVTIVPGTYFPPVYYQESCEFTFITDALGRVNAWQARGDGCASYRPETVLRSAS